MLSQSLQDIVQPPSYTLGDIAHRPFGVTDADAQHRPVRWAGHFGAASHLNFTTWASAVRIGAFKGPA